MARIEHWVEIAEFPEYSVSSMGRVRREETDHILPVQVNREEVRYVPLWSYGRQYQRGVAKLVAKAFCMKLVETFEGVIQLDGDRSNCAAHNLMWRPRWFVPLFNKQWRGSHRWRCEDPIVDLATSKVYRGTPDVASQFGLLERDVMQSIANRTYVYPTYQQFDFLA